MRMVVVAFGIAAACLIANETALAKGKPSHRPSSDRQPQHSLHDAGCGGIRVSIAAIQAGELLIAGQAPSPRATVSADGRASTGSDRNGRFALHLAYYPASCVVPLKSGNSERKAIVANCAVSGTRGGPGPTGARGEPGPVAPLDRKARKVRPARKARRDRKGRKASKACKAHRDFRDHKARKVRPGCAARLDRPAHGSKPARKSGGCGRPARPAKSAP